MTKLIFGSGRFASTVTNNQNIVLVGGFDVPTKLVDSERDVALCLPADLDRWGMYPTHQDSWLSLFFVVGCHSRHEDEEGLEIRREAFERIPEEQWSALAAMAHSFVAEFEERLYGSEELSPRKIYKSLTRALQDCLLYLPVGGPEFPEDQDRFLSKSSISHQIQLANRGRDGKLDWCEGNDLLKDIRSLVNYIVSEHSHKVLPGMDYTPWGALDRLREEMAGHNGRVILLPEGVSLEQGADLVEYDLMIGTPDEHDIDVVSIVSFVSQPTLFQLTDVLSGQRMDIISVPSTMGPQDELTGGHPSFQSIAEMLLANGTPVSKAGKRLVARLSGQVDPRELAQKYLRVARQFLIDASFRKSWAARRDDPSVPQIKKAIPLYRIACDLLPRASYMLRTGKHTGGGIGIETLASQAGLAAEYQAIRSFLDAQDASQEELEKVAEALRARLKEIENEN